MPPITAVLHTHNDALRLGRALETLFPCGEVLVIDHGSVDATRRIARNYGARIVAAGEAQCRYLDLASHDWIFFLGPAESISEGLQSSLFEFRDLAPASVAHTALAVSVRHQAAEGWLEASVIETRLLSRGSPMGAPCLGRKGYFPAHQPSAPVLEGEILRFHFP
ncbi:MAG: hypothetical protein ABSF59_01775 [Candidatus Sulfotelmatobacter sp.]|jgi:hypothetical protein